MLQTLNLDGWVKEALTTEVGQRVTQRDIDTAVPGDPENCAIAIAAGRLPGVVKARVWRTKVWLFHDDGTIRMADLDGNAKNLVKAIDVTGTASATDIKFLPPKPKSTATARVRKARAVAATKDAATLAGVRKGASIIYAGTVVAKP